MAFWALLLFLLLFSCSCGVCSSVKEKELLPLKMLHKHPSNSRSCFSQKSRSKNGATLLELKHHDSCTDPKPNHSENRLVLDEARFRSIQTRIINTLLSTPQTEIPIHSGLKLQTLNYMITVSLGGKNLTLLVDTGSDLTWIQCQPCKQCYTQQDPIFNPILSPSYQSVQCSEKACQNLQFSLGKTTGLCGNNDAKCNYAVTYGDGSYTSGNLGKDELVLGSVSIQNLVFGCGIYNKGLFGSASGLIGLGRSDLSLVSQSFDSFNGVFSYCLPASDNGLSGSLVLGNDSSVFRQVSYTNLLQNPDIKSFYIVNLTGIEIGGVKLPSRPYGRSETIIDSGTVITRLPLPIYTSVKNEFLKQFQGYPDAPGFSILDTCFNLTGYDEVDVPKMKFRFEGDAEMDVDASGMLYFVKRDRSQVCLALSSFGYDDGVGIIGNYQQRNVRVVYDSVNFRVGFAKENCTFSL